MLQGMISYYLLVTIVDAPTAVAEDDSADRRGYGAGRSASSSSRWTIWTYRLCLLFLRRMVYTVVSPVPFTLHSSDSFVTLSSGDGLPPSSTARWSRRRCFSSFAYTMALLAFWFWMSAPSSSSHSALNTSAAGIFPLDILPPAARRCNLFPVSVPLLFSCRRGLSRTNPGQRAGPRVRHSIGLGSLWAMDWPAGFWARASGGIRPAADANR